MYSDIVTLYHNYPKIWVFDNQVICLESAD